MFTINGRKFARTEKEFTASLFDSTGTCTGYYKVLKGRIILSDGQKTPRVAIVNTDRVFAVTCHKLDNGNLRYMFALTGKDRQWLGFDDLTIQDANAAIKKAAEGLI